MTTKVIKDTTDSMKKAVEHLQKEFSTLHTGKASPAMVEGVHVEVYGSMMKLRDVAAITTPDARMILVQPWDRALVPVVEKAIRAANVGLNPVVAETTIRCPIPELSRERRQEFVKTASVMSEDSKVRIRALRRDALEQFKHQKKEGSLSEDDFKRLEKEVQHLHDKFMTEIDKQFEHKEKELMQI